MSTDFCFKQKVTEDFMKMIWVLTEVKNILEEAINLNMEKNSVDFIRQDLKTLANAKNAILDEKIADKLDEAIEKKKQELDEKTKQKTENAEKIAKLLSSYKEFESYSKIVKNMYDSVKDDLSINIDKIDTEEYIAFLFAGIRFDFVNIEESPSETYYDEAANIFMNGRAAIEQLSETK